MVLPRADQRCVRKVRIRVVRMVAVGEQGAGTYTILRHSKERAGERESVVSLPRTRPSS